MKATYLRVVMAAVGVGIGAATQWAIGRHAQISAEQSSHDAAERASVTEKKLAAAEIEMARLQKEIAAEKEQMAALAGKEREDSERREAKRQANAAAKQASRATQIASANLTTGPHDQPIEGANDPAVVRRLNEQARLQIGRRYETLFDQLALSPDKKEQLIKLLADKRQAAADVAASMFQNGADPRDDPNGYIDMLAATREDVEKQIASLLGDSGYQTYQAFDRGIGQSQVMARMNLLLAEIQQPLSGEQATQLQASMQANNAGRVTGKVVKDATAFLNPAQMQVLRDLRAIQQANSQKRLAPVAPLPGGN